MKDSGRNLERSKAVKNPEHIEEIQKSRDALEEFMQGNEQKFSFAVECPLSERIKYIYSVIFPGWQKQRFYLRYFFSRIAYFTDYSPIKCLIYRVIGVKIGKGVFISSDVVIDVHFPHLIEIEDYVVLGHGARIFTHEFSDATYTLGRVMIGEGTVVGGFATLRRGVSIGKDVTVPINKVVSRNIEKKHG